MKNTSPDHPTILPNRVHLCPKCGFDIVAHETEKAEELLKTLHGTQRRLSTKAQRARVIRLIAKGLTAPAVAEKTDLKPNAIYGIMHRARLAGHLTTRNGAQSHANGEAGRTFVRVSKNRRAAILRLLAKQLGPTEIARRTRVSKAAVKRIQEAVT